MRWYFALNEGGTRGGISLHTRLAVLSAKRNTNLQPVMLYMGKPNEFITWLEENGVTVIYTEPNYLPALMHVIEQGKYSVANIGHWLRTNVCLTETQDEFVLYTDIDVLFLKQPDLTALRPKYFAAAPEFNPDSWNYFNSGVMWMRVPGLRDDYAAFETYLIKNITEKGNNFSDQIAYNIFYRGRWAQLPVEYNWKPYWGLNSDATIVHLHGPKFDAILAILEGRWDWGNKHGTEIGSLFIGFFESYLDYFKLITSYADDLPPDDARKIQKILDLMLSYDVAKHASQLNLSLLDYKMFPPHEWDEAFLPSKVLQP